MSISVENLCKYYGTQLALDHLSFEVNPGEVLGFLGPNGAGKSTTMKIITGYIQPSSGSVCMGNFSLEKDPLAMRREIGYLPEHNPLYPDMYIREYLTFACKLYGIGGKEAQSRVKTVIEQTGLQLEQHKKIQSLSKGYRQRVGIAQALIHQPNVLILDEPTSGLDPNQLGEIRSLIKEVGKEKTVIFSSHILSEVEAIADRVLILHQGKLVANESLLHLRDTSFHNQSMVFDLTLDKPGFDPSPILAHPEVVSMEAYEETKWRIQVQNGAEIRGILFKSCYEQGYVIYELKKETYSLEHIFSSLTQT